MAGETPSVLAGMQAAIPFNNHLGLRYLEISPGRCTVSLPDEPGLHNHIGTQHAAGMFAAGEAASGGAFVGAFGTEMSGMMPLAERADISYKQLAMGEIMATATLDEERDGILDRLAADGRVRFPVGVSLTDAAGQVVAEMTVHWYVKKVG